MGSRAASLCSVLVAQLYASTYNDDKRLLTFSDSVQDAAHRAGFFTARTFRFNLRAALQQYVMAEGEGKSLDQLGDCFCDYWRKRWEGDEYRFISTFLPPDLAWLEQYEQLIHQGALPPDQTLSRDLRKRMGWEVLSEYGFNSRIGRTLEKTSSSVAYLDAVALEGALATLLSVLRNEVGSLRELSAADLRRFVLGVMTQLRIQGGILHPALERYVEDGGNIWAIKAPWMRRFGKFARAPEYLAQRSTMRFSALVSKSPTHRTWFQKWTEKCFDHLSPTISAEADLVYEALLKVLEDKEVVERREAKGNPVWGLRPQALRVSTEVSQFRCGECGQNVSVATAEDCAWQGAPCMRFHCGGHLAQQESAGDYYGKLYAQGDIERIFAAEHTGLLKRDPRETLETEFKAEGQDRQPWYPNLLSCTPTLEMGIDIGALSSLILCSVPPGQANYLQRIGRTGRRDGNSFNVTVANGRPHDLYFFAEPQEMIAGEVEAPGIFLEAPAVIERQFTAFCFDRWVEKGVAVNAVPARISEVLSVLDKPNNQTFPHSLLAFIELHRSVLFDDFLRLFGIEEQSVLAQHLLVFVTGDQAREGSLSLKILQGLQSMHAERKSLQKTIKRLTKQIADKQAEKARGKAFEEELDELTREKSGLGKLYSEQGKKDVFNFCTDEGLLPNYAFPEAGVILRSLIFRRRSNPKPGQGNYETTAFEYERAAASAISELAPQSEFYAQGRKVTIDQVNMDVSEVEDWRLCKECSHTQRVSAEGGTNNCPSCGDAFWSDEGQKQQMLRMRQVFANTSDQKSRISDDSDDRRPRFFSRKLLVDFDGNYVKKAFRIDSDDLPFGFEFVSRVTLREINFGELSDDGQDLAVAGDTIKARGFKVCRSCGKVHLEKRGKGNNSEPQHAFSCTARERDSAKNFFDCIYLYREFSSEAIRILLPLSNRDSAKGKLNSLVASLHLGLKRKFGGNIDHLKATVYDDPDPESKLRRQYLVLYDSVPGGTGYLKELMRSENVLLEIFDQALAALKACDCNRDPSKDGCYRCLFAYRRANEMSSTSRNEAVKLLSEILKYRDSLLEIPSLREISLNSLFDSELEARFVEALRRACKEARRGDIVADKLVTDRENKLKHGYAMQIGKRHYEIEPQVPLGEAEGVSIPSRADFVFWPKGETGGGRPIVVFTDGYEYHKERIGHDLAQRMAVVQSGRYWAWSLSWQDVEWQFSGQDNYYNDYLELQGLPQGRQFHEKFVGALNLNEPGKIGGENAFQWLLRFLAAEEQADAETSWQAHAFARGLTHLRGGETASARWQAGVDAILPLAAESAKPLAGEGQLFGYFEKHGGSSSRLLKLYISAPMSAVGALQPEAMRVAAYLDDRTQAREKSGFQQIWNGYLRLYNLFQFLPRAAFVSAEGLARRQYEALVFELDKPKEREEGDTQGAAWREVMELVFEPELQPLMRALQDAGWPAPATPGYELIDATEDGNASEALLAWPDIELAFLESDYMETKDVFESKGWQVIALSEAVAAPDAFVGAYRERSGR